MDNIERIHELMDELASVIKKEFPGYTSVSAVCDRDGYRSLMVTRWGKGEKPKTTKRRMLFSQSKIGGDPEWGADGSSEQNQYYASLGVLLKD